MFVAHWKLFCTLHFPCHAMIANMMHSTVCMVHFHWIRNKFCSYLYRCEVWGLWGTKKLINSKVKVLMFNYIIPCRLGILGLVVNAYVSWVEAKQSDQVNNMVLDFWRTRVSKCRERISYYRIRLKCLKRWV